MGPSKMQTSEYSNSYRQLRNPLFSKPLIYDRDVLIVKGMQYSLHRRSSLPSDQETRKWACEFTDGARFFKKQVGEQ